MGPGRVWESSERATQQAQHSEVETLTSGLCSRLSPLPKLAVLFLLSLHVCLLPPDIICCLAWETGGFHFRGHAPLWRSEAAGLT